MNSNAIDKLSLFISIAALLVSALSIYLGFFYKQANLVARVSPSMDFEVGMCEDENNNGLCLKFDVEIDSILINSGNMPATLLSAVIGVPDSFGENKSCKDVRSIHGMDGEIKIVESLYTTLDKRHLSSYEFLEDLAYKGELNNILNFCILFSGLDSRGREISGKQLLFSINIEPDNDEYLIHSGSTTSIISIK